MKRFLLIALAAIMALSLFACGGTEEEGSSTTTTTSTTAPQSTQGGVEKPDDTTSSTGGTEKPVDPTPSTEGTEKPVDPTPDPDPTPSTEGTEKPVDPTPDPEPEPEPEIKPLENIAFKSDSFEYDTTEHEITVTGNIPDGVSVVYKGGENGKNGATNVGTYTITATISGEGYETLVLTATLKITSKQELLHVYFYNGAVYFQNALDKNTLYSYVGGQLVKVSRDVPTNMITADGKMFYVSENLLSKGLSFVGADGDVEDLLDMSADMLATDGTSIYYNVNSLISSEKNGIYKLSIAELLDDEAEPTPVKLTGVKTGNIVYAQGYIYFVNKSNGSKLCAVSVNAVEAEPTVIYDYKVSELMSDDTHLFFVKKMALDNLSFEGSAIYRINVTGGLNTLVDDESNKVNRVCASNGKYIVKIGSYIYFLNTDMLTTSIFGDGIYRAPVDGSGWVDATFDLLSGAAMVVDGADDNIYSLTTDGTNLYYYRASTKHLYKYDLENEIEVDLMKNYIPKANENIIYTYYEKSVKYGNAIYFINMNDGGKLYKYDITTGDEYRITSAQVADFAIYEGDLYYASVKLLVNFDLYKMSLTTGEPVRLSTDKCLNLSFFGDKIYYTNFSGDNTLNSMNLDGTGDTVIYGGAKGEESVDDGKTFVIDGYVYFVADEKIYRYNISEGTADMLDKDLEPHEYLVADGKILIKNRVGISNHVDIYDLATGERTEVQGLGVVDDARGMFVYNGTFYFYRNVAAGSDKKGLYKVVGDEAVLVSAMEGYYICNAIVDGDKLYFINVWQVQGTVPTPSSDACLYELDLKTLKVTKLN